MIPLRDESAPPATAGTAAVAGVTTLAFLWQLTVSGSGLLTGHHTPDAQALFSQYGFTPQHPTLTAALTHALLHVSLLHLLSNLLFLQLFGPALEARCGMARFLTLYTISAAAAALSYLAVQPGSPHPLAGASGAVAGVAAAYAVTCPGNRILLLTPHLTTTAVPAALLLSLWLLWQVAQPLISPQALGSLAAHAGGAAGGAALAVALRPVLRR